MARFFPKAYRPTIAPFQSGRGLYIEVEKVVEDKRHGYSSMAEFTKEAIGLHLQRVVKPIIKTIVENRIKRGVYRRRFEEIFRE